MHLASQIFHVYKHPVKGNQNQLFVRQGVGLQGQAVFNSKLSFRPHSTESSTHKKMTLSLAERYQNAPEIELLTKIRDNPEQNREEMIKKENERLRASSGKLSRQKRGREKGARLLVNYVEPVKDDSEDEGAVSLNAIKNEFKKSPSKNEGRKNSSDDDVEITRAQRWEKAKALSDSDEYEEVYRGDSDGKVKKTFKGDGAEDEKYGFKGDGAEDEKDGLWWKC